SETANRTPGSFTRPRFAKSAKRLPLFDPRPCPGASRRLAREIGVPSLLAAGHTEVIAAFSARIVSSPLDFTLHLFHRRNVLGAMNKGVVHRDHHPAFDARRIAVRGICAP